MSQNRIRRMKLQHQAEGYLELGMSQQALDVLDRLGTPTTPICTPCISRAKPCGVWDDTPKPSTPLAASPRPNRRTSGLAGRGLVPQT